MTKAKIIEKIATNIGLSAVGQVLAAIQQSERRAAPLFGLNQGSSCALERAGNRLEALSSRDNLGRREAARLSENLKTLRRSTG